MVRCVLSIANAYARLTLRLLVRRTALRVNVLFDEPT